MALVSEVKEGPHLTITFQDNMPASSSVATIRASLGDEFLPAEMGRACPPVACTAIDLYIIDKV
jgi:hypothetical protein